MTTRQRERASELARDSLGSAVASISGARAMTAAGSERAALAAIDVAAAHLKAARAVLVDVIFNTGHIQGQEELSGL